ncbi:MAG: hypothetical protein CMF52_06540 [Legionellales bacterium]|nr:hypothetical protein [Legionellales bacterium]|tara:strand:- start:1139 stop:1462 length:324 start_codon:yes stop_codon:yes gene_type:complete
MSKISRFQPTNRHLLIVPHVQKNETNTGVLLPEDYDLDVDRYIEATVVAVAEDCHKQFRYLKYPNHEPEKKIVIDRSMISEVKIKDRIHHLILENYVLGIYRRPDEV